MPKINVYLPAELAAAVKEHAIPVSTVCQQALEAAVRAASVLHGEATGSAAAGTTGSPATGTRTITADRLTRRAREVIDTARRLANERGDEPKAVDVVLGILDEGQNLAVTVLTTLDIDPDDLRAELVGLLARDKASALDELAAILRRAVGEALRLGHNYVGCEHLLLGIVTGNADDLAVQAFRRMGVEPTATRRATNSALAGYYYARSNTPLAVLGANISGALEDIKARLARLETR